MKRFLIALLAVTLAGPTAWAQRGTYVVQREASLSSSAEVVTIRLPSGTAVTAGGFRVSVYSSDDVEITVERDGTYSSGTSLTVNKTHTGDAANTALATYGTSISGTTVLHKYEVVGYTTLSVSLEDVSLTAGEALTIRTESATVSKLLVNIRWREY